MSEQCDDLDWWHTGLLLQAASRAVVKLYRPYLDPLTLTHPQFLVLLVLELGQPRAVTEISKELVLTPATMTPILKRLASLGYISRSRDNTDERRLSITLTDSGLALLPELRAIQTRVNNAVGFTNEDGRYLREFITSVASTDAPAV